MGVINVSPESFYAGSVSKNASAISRMCRRMAQEGADFLDVGAMSTAPYLKTAISPEEEIRRLTQAIRIIRKITRLPISADTSRARVAEAALAAGARIINDITGLRGDAAMAKIAKKAEGLILMAHPSALPPTTTGDPISEVAVIFKNILAVARRHNISLGKIALDPGIGFFRDRRLAWWKWDVRILHDLRTLERLGQPLLLGVSRKSFIGQLLNQPHPEDRLPGSLAATTAAILNGARVLRTHDVAATREAAVIAASIRGV
jgi:dihydropteroate synthase